MRYRHSLRKRLVASYPVFGAILGLLMALTLFFGLEALERELMGNYVAEELQHFMASPAAAHPGALQRARYWTAYRVPAGDGPAALEHLSRLSPGFHEVEHHGREYHVGVAEQGSSRYYVVYDDSGFELRETLVMAFLSGSVLLAIVSATWLGFSMSGRVIEPIADLARRVERLEADDTQRPLAADYPADEVGTLARAIDAYRERLNAFVRREREFTADASHELRTPLAVIQAASEGLLAREDVPQNVQQRVERIHRAAAEMARTLTVLLELARESRMPSASAEQTDIAALVEQLVEDQRPGLAGRPLELAVETTARPHVGAPPAVVSTVIGNLLRNALAYTEQGHVRIHLDRTRLRIEDTGPGIAAFDLPKVFERGFRTSAVTAPGNGLGLAIARRICDQFAWELQLGNTHGGGAWAEWRFGAG